MQVTKSTHGDSCHVAMAGDETFSLIYGHGSATFHLCINGDGPGSLSLGIKVSQLPELLDLLRALEERLAR